MTRQEIMIRFEEILFMKDIEIETNQFHEILKPLINSLDLLDLIMFIERDFAIAITDKEIADIKTMNDLLDLIHLKVNSK